MALSNTHDSYGSVAKVFHWLTALLIFTALPLGIIANGIEVSPETLPRKAQLFSIHKTVGIAAFAVALARILWALIQTKPGLLHPDRRAESFMAETAHWLLYASLVIVPLSGWLHHAATEGFAPILWPFGQSLPLVPKSVAVAEFFAVWHYVFVIVLGVTLAAHVAGALKHHVIDRDATLRRMWFGSVRAAAPSGGHAGAAPFLAALALYVAAMGVASAMALSEPHEAPAPETPVAAAPEEPAADGAWVVEDGTLAITVRQLGSDVGGSFGDWSARIVYDETAKGPVKGAVEVEIGIASLTLGSVTSDALGPDFFDAAQFPTAAYAGEIVETEAGLRVDGMLDLKGVQAEVPLDFTLAIDGDRAAMQGGAVIDRRSFAIGESYAGEDAVGFDVAVSVELTALRAR